MIRFNTFRTYHPMFGQRIAAQILPNNRVAFVDVDRHIDGVTHREFKGTPHRRDIAEFVMRDYDACQYEGMMNFQLKEALIAFAKLESEVMEQDNF